MVQINLKDICSIHLKERCVLKMLVVYFTVHLILSLISSFNFKTELLTMGSGIFKSLQLVTQSFYKPNVTKWAQYLKKLICTKNMICSFKFNQAQRISHLSINLNQQLKLNLGMHTSSHIHCLQ